MWKGRVTNSIGNGRLTQPSRSGALQHLQLMAQRENLELQNRA